MYEEFIEAWSPLVDEVLGCYLCEHPSLSYLADDLKAAGLLCLCQIANGGYDQGAEDIRGYLWSSVRRSMQKAVRDEDCIKRPKGKEPIEFEPLSQQSLSYESDEDARDLLGAIFFGCRDSTDLTIVRLRLKEMTNVEIATQLGISESAVSQRLTRLSKLEHLREV